MGKKPDFDIIRDSKFLDCLVDKIGVRIYYKKRYVFGQCDGRKGNKEKQP